MPTTPPAPEPPSDRDVAELPPFVVASVPAHLDMDVDPALDTLEATFSEDMGGGCSWLSINDLTPPMQDPEWVDARTCRIGVTLAPETTYVVQLNGGPGAAR